MECCCAACSCINACCPSPRGGGGKRRSKHRGDNTASVPPPPNQGYQPTPAPYYSTPAAAPAAAVPQFATFDASNRKKVNADALPPMPSWDAATSKKVVDESQTEEMEMDKLDQHDETRPMLAAAAAATAAGTASPRMGNTAYGQGGAAGGGGGGYSDGVGQGYGRSGSYEAQNGVAAGVGAGARPLASRNQTGSSSQGYQNPNFQQQRPGIIPSYDSYNSTTTSNTAYTAQSQQPQNYGPRYNNNNNPNPTYTHPRVPLPTSTSPPYAHSTTSYGITQAPPSRANPEYSFAPSYASTPNQPQPIYNNNNSSGHGENQRGMTQSPYQAYPGGQAGGGGQRGEQNVWRDV